MREGFAPLLTYRCMNCRETRDMQIPLTDVEGGVRIGCSECGDVTVHLCESIPPGTRRFHPLLWSAGP